MLAIDEALEIGLENAPRWAAAAGIEFLALPVTDHGIPTDVDAVSRAVDRVCERLRDGRGVAAHCYAGLGRSPLFVAATLISSGYTAPDAIRRISEARGFAVPEMKSQHDWLHSFAVSRQRS
jgi:protein-tyrosine phosphatase